MVLMSKVWQLDAGRFSGGSRFQRVMAHEPLATLFENQHGDRERRGKQLHLAVMGAVPKSALPRSV